MHPCSGEFYFILFYYAPLHWSVDDKILRLLILCSMDNGHRHRCRSGHGTREFLRNGGDMAIFGYKHPVATDTYVLLQIYTHVYITSEGGRATILFGDVDIVVLNNTNDVFSCFWMCSGS